jgi:branched-chain amino acid transport system substrate-binding protein
MTANPLRWAATVLAVATPLQAQAEILIGMAGPLTGPNAWLGEQTQRGVEMAVADFNGKGGVLGEEARVMAVDDFCRGEQAVAAANKLVAEGVALVAGHQCSGAAIPASQVYADAGILMISNAATNPELTEQGFDTVFRVVGRDDQQGAIAGTYLAEHWGEKKIAILHDGQAYGKGLAEETKQKLNQLGVRETIFEAIEPGRVDYSDLISRMQAQGIDTVYYGGYAPEAALIIRQARDAGDDLQLIASDGISSEDFWLIAGEAAEGTLMTLYPDARNRPEAADVVARFRATNFEPAAATLNGYAVIQVWAQAAEKAGTVDAGPVAEALRAGEFDTVLGTIGFDEKGDVRGFEPFIWYVWRDGDFAPLEPISATK